MRAAQFQKPGVMAIIDQPLRTLRDNEVTVEIAACGVCGTDVHIFAGEAHARPPVILGHEFAGTVVAVGSRAGDLRPGDKVAIDPNITCGACHYCRRGQVQFCEQLRALGVDIDGAFAEYALVPAQQCYFLPADFPLELGAFAEPLSCCLRGLGRAAVQPGETVALVGAGAIGLLLLQLVRLAGAGQVFALDPLPAKRAIAQKLGADLVLDPASAGARAEIEARTHGGCDVVIECAGNAEAAELAFALTKRGSRVVLFGLAPPQAVARLPLQAAFLKELTILGSILNPFTFHTAVTLLAQGRIDLAPLSREYFSVEQTAAAVANVRQGNAVKTLVLPHGRAAI